METYRFRNREEAGHILSAHLVHYGERPDVLVLGVPRGGVVVAAEVARTLGCDLDVLVSGRLVVPGREDLTLGALSPHGAVSLDLDVAGAFGLPPSVLDAMVKEEREEMRRRDTRFRGERPPPELRNRTLIIVDDGHLAGGGLRAVLRAVRREHPARIVVALPVATINGADRLGDDADEVVTAALTETLPTLGAWYSDYPLVTDDHIRELLTEAEARRKAA